MGRRRTEWDSEQEKTEGAGKIEKKMSVKIKEIKVLAVEKSVKGLT